MEVALCGAGFVALVLLVFISAILRFFRVSVAWNIDLALFLLAWTSFLGADIAWRSGNLMGMDLLTKKLPSIVQKIIELSVYLIVFCALIIIIVFGSQLAWTERLRRYQSLPIPYSLMTLSLILAALSMSVSTIVKIKRCVLSFKPKEKDGLDKGG
jgi:TRAP-type C4-dicarboxylate transport system permease small subunit